MPQSSPSTVPLHTDASRLTVLHFHHLPGLTHLPSSYLQSQRHSSGLCLCMATALLNQRSHLQSSQSNKQQLVNWGHSDSAEGKTTRLWPLFHKLRGSVLVAPTETENLWPLLALGTRRGVALPHLCRLLLLCTALKAG